MRRVITLAPDLTNEKIAEMIRKARWGDKVKCPHCGSTNIEKVGHASKPYIQKYHCKNCGKYFNDLTGTPLSGTHLSLRTVALIAYLYLKLGLTGEAIRRELGISKKAVQRWIKIINRQAKFFQGYDTARRASGGR